MADNPLFYKEIVPLDRSLHQTFKLKTNPKRFGFAAQAYMIPATIDEFLLGGRHLPIVFVPGPKVPSAVFLTGLRPGDNRFVAADASWTGDYIPAFVRRYPFIIGEIEGADPVVCIDQASTAFDDAAGDPLFQKTGEETALLREHIIFINEYMSAAKRTDAFLTEVASLDLLQSITIDVKLADRDNQTLHGLMVINADKLTKIKDADFLRLRDLGYLPSIYAHLSSLGGLDRLGSASLS